MNSKWYTNTPKINFQCFCGPYIEKLIISERSFCFLSICHENSLTLSCLMFSCIVSHFIYIFGFLLYRCITCSVNMMYYIWYTNQYREREKKKQWINYLNFCGLSFYYLQRNKTRKQAYAIMISKQTWPIFSYVEKLLSL